MIVKKLMLSVALATASVTALSAGAGTAMAQPADFRAQANAILEAAYPAEGPGAAVVVTRGGRVIYAGGRGFADVEARRPITPETAFPLGSIVKQFTAATILQLVAEGRMSLDDPMSRFFPDWPQPGAAATIRQLLNHSSGIQDFTKIPGWIARNRTRPWTTDQLVAVARDLPARAQPGHAWEYNNGGYVLLGAIIERVTGKAWHEAIAERIARPLGLRTIAYGASDDALRVTTRGYTSEEGRQQPVQTSHWSVAGAAGGLVGSVSDMARWAQAFHHGGVVSPALYREMTSPARLADGSTQPYGFGLRLRQIRGRPAFVHGGAGRGLDTDSLYIPSEDVFVAVFANSDDPATDPSILTRRLAALALGEPVPTLSRVPLDMAAVEPLFGLYSSEEDEPIRFFSEGGKLFAGQGDGQREAFPAGDDRFFFGSDDLGWFRFVRRPDGAHVVELHNVENAQPRRAVRIGPVPPAFAVVPAVLQSYAGTYATETVVVTVALDENGRLTVSAPGQPPLAMRPVSETEFRIDSNPMRVVFHPENGAVNRLTIHRGARELHGQRTGR